MFVASVLFDEADDARYSGGAFRALWEARLIELLRRAVTTKEDLPVVVSQLLDEPVQLSTLATIPQVLIPEALVLARDGTGALVAAAFNRAHVSRVEAAIGSELARPLEPDYAFVNIAELAAGGAGGGQVVPVFDVIVVLDGAGLPAEIDALLASAAEAGTVILLDDRSAAVELRLERARLSAPEFTLVIGRDSIGFAERSGLLRPLTLKQLQDELENRR